MAAGIVAIPNVVVGDSKRTVLYWSSDGTVNGNLTELTISASGGPPADVINQLGQASGVAPVTGTFTGVAIGPQFLPQPGRDINVTIVAAVALVGVSIRLERSFDAGLSWVPLTINGSPWAVYSGAVSEVAWNEPEAGMQYRLNCTAYGSGTANYRISH